MRLIDRLATIEVSPYWRRVLDTATVVVADSVSQYYFEGTDQEIWNIEKDFPNIAPPWPVTFLEARAPHFINSSVHGRLPWNSHRPEVHAYGAIVFGVPAKQYVEECVDLSNMSGEGYAAMRRMMVHPDAKWILSIVPFFQVGRDEPPHAPAFVNTWAVTAEGQPVRVDGSGNYCAVTQISYDDRRPLTSEELRNLHDTTAYVNHVVMLTYSFAHCRNIVVRDVVPPKKLAKRTLERHGVALRRYSVVEIEPMRQVLRTEGGQDGATGAQRALHICRGHFKTYRERGLFGKHKGTYFWPMFARGDQASGTVVSSYRVTPDQGSVSDQQSL